ncbi:MAG: hypothetical protein ABIK86_07395, partial [candidate division WOR-3 bacterium]
MRRSFGRVLVWIGVVPVLFFIVLALIRSRPGRKTPTTPDLASAPARVYGTVEPLGGPIYVSAPVSRSIIRIAAREGDTVRAGQVLVELDNSVEAAQVAAAAGRAEAARKAWAISRETWERSTGLKSTNGISDQEYRSALLKAQLDSALAAAAEADLRLAQAALEQLTLKSPVNGLVYKLDVRLGQTLAAGDDSKITLGSPRLQVRMFVESFWHDRLKVGDSCRVFDPETGRDLGSGRVLSISPYVG